MIKNFFFFFCCSRSDFKRARKLFVHKRDQKFKKWSESKFCIWKTLTHCWKMNRCRLSLFLLPAEERGRALPQTLACNDGDPGAETAGPARSSDPRAHDWHQTAHCSQARLGQRVSGKKKTHSGVTSVRGDGDDVVNFNVYVYHIFASLADFLNFFINNKDIVFCARMLIYSGMQTYGQPC